MQPAPRIWVIVPGDPPLLTLFWEQGLREGWISIGWSKVGDVIGRSRTDIQAAVDRAYPGESPNGGLMIDTFLHAVQVGDTVVARSDLSHALGIGRVSRRGFYDPNRCSVGSDGSGERHALFIGVDWDPTFRPCAMPNSRFLQMGTIRPISEAKLAEVRRIAAAAAATPAGSSPATMAEALVAGDDEERLEAEIAGPLRQFALEKYLESFLVDHFARVFPGGLEIYQSPDGEADGQQFQTDVGRIDILAYHPGERAFVVIELKKGRESDAVVGQAARYMTWVRLNLCRNGETVRGLIVCAESDDKMRHAVMAVPGLELRHYQIDFRLLTVEAAKPAAAG